MGQVVCDADERFSTGVGEFDRVLGGGLAPGATVLLAGEPGIGKSTLTLQVASGVEGSGRDVVIVCGEESVGRVAARARRVGRLERARLSPAVHIDELLAHIAGADLAVVDSVQALVDPALPGGPGSVSQVRGCALRLAKAARDSGTVLLLVGHVTKDGSVAGPRVLEHIVDVICSFEGDKAQMLRTVRSVKNRFGPTGEVGVFEMTASGLREVPDASGLFLAGRGRETSGSAVACILHGSRPMMLEVQALVAPASAMTPRRVATGIETSRLSMMVAILEQRAGIMFAGRDVYASVAGGFKAAEPGVDLALALALAAGRRNLVAPAGLAAVGEVGLGGEVRAVSGIQVRLKEIERLGFRRVVASPSVEGYEGLTVHPVEDVRAAIEIAFERESSK